MKGQKTGGRKKGTPNKSTKDVRLKLQAMGCDPVKAMARIAMKAEEDGDTEIALRAYKELALYVAPKLRAIEIIEKGAEEEPKPIKSITYIEEDASREKQASH